jgi:RimJ/RimL family protein N-acetyltransferase
VDADPAWGSCLIQLRENDFFVGGIGLKGSPDSNGDVEIGYGLAEGGRGRGYATEAVTAILDRARAHSDVRRVLAYTDPANVASHRVLVRTGFALIDKSEPEWCWAVHVRR